MNDSPTEVRWFFFANDHLTIAPWFESSASVASDEPFFQPKR